MGSKSRQKSGQSGGRPAKLPPQALVVREESDVFRLGFEAQFTRCTTRDDPQAPLSERDIIDRQIDAQLFLVPLWWLRVLAGWAMTASYAGEKLRAAIAEFDRSLPDLKELRNTQEHFDDYGGGIGNRQLGGKESHDYWQFLTIPGGGGGLSYGRFQIDLLTALGAGRRLHRALRATVDPLVTFRPPMVADP